MKRPQFKFRLKQLVRWRNSRYGDEPGRIRRRAIIEREKHPVYWIGNGGYIPENYLREWFKDTHLLVRIERDDDGELKPDRNDWHLVDPASPDGQRALCTGEIFGASESTVVFETKEVKRGGITCQLCLERLKAYKRIRL